MNAIEKIRNFGRIQCLQKIMSKNYFLKLDYTTMF